MNIINAPVDTSISEAATENIGILGIENENKIFSVKAWGINGTAQKQSTVKIADDGKKRLNLFLDDFELSIIMESIGARIRREQTQPFRQRI